MAIDLKAERKVWVIYQEEQDTRSNRNDFTKKQQFRADFSMTLDMFFAIATSFRNKLEKYGN